METYITSFAFLALILVVWYLKPLIIQRIKTKKVKVVVVSRSGKKINNTLYLYPDDPLWKVIKMHQGGDNE
ncbi:hypothetical protein [Aliivibrio wodanis]|uniref:hypothetical protein n=1 Tax=Aliivibrio wodanis TaxID=80852 RepID=UPI00406C0520